MALDKLDTHSNPSQMKEDARLVRTKTSDYLNMLRKMLRNFDLSYRQEYLPPPTRENPFPDKKALAFVNFIKKQETRIEHIETLIRGADSSLDDTSWAKHKDKNSVLQRLYLLDEEMMLSVTKFYDDFSSNPMNTDSVELLESFLTSFERLFKDRQEYLRVQVQTVTLKF